MSTPAAPYGPNTVAIRRFLQRLAALTPDDWADAARGYAAIADAPRFRAADRALGVAIDRAARTTERDAALGPLLQLVRAAPEPDASPDDDVALDPVAEPALAALLALLARDLLDEETVSTLYAPFASLIPRSTLGEG